MELLATGASASRDRAVSSFYEPDAGHAPAASPSSPQPHEEPLADLAARLGTRVDGHDPKASLGQTAAHASRVLASGLRNRITPPPRPSELKKYLMQFTDLLMVLMIAAMVLTLIVYAIGDKNELVNLYIAILLCVLVLVTTIFSYLQERSVDNIMATFGYLTFFTLKVLIIYIYI
jgi:hypothetical protein